MMWEQSYCKWLLPEYRFDGGTTSGTEVMPRRAGRVLWLWDTLVTVRLPGTVAECLLQGQGSVRWRRRCRAASVDPS